MRTLLKATEDHARLDLGMTNPQHGFQDAVAELFDYQDYVSLLEQLREVFFEAVSHGQMEPSEKSESLFLYKQLETFITHIGHLHNISKEVCHD